MSPALTKAERHRVVRHPGDRYDYSLWRGRRIVDWRGRFWCPKCLRRFVTLHARHTHYYKLHEPGGVR